MMFRLRFQQRFVPLIQQGLKFQTYRRGERAPRLGQRLRLTPVMTDMSIIPDPMCTAVIPVTIRCLDGKISTIRVGGVPVLHLDRWAIDDGFADIDDLSVWHIQQYGAQPFRGHVIEWAASPYCMADRVKEFAA